MENKEKNIDNKPSLKGIRYGNLEGERFRQDTTSRKYLSIWVACVITLWLGFTAFIFIKYGDVYPEVVICTLLGTTTANIIGLGYIVLKGLFPNKDK